MSSTRKDVFYAIRLSGRFERLRANLHGYREIYIKVRRETLFRRDKKGLYSAGKNVVGVDLPFDEPKNPDIVVENDGDETPEAIVERLEAALGLS